MDKLAIPSSEHEREPHDSDLDLQFLSSSVESDLNTMFDESCYPPGVAKMPRPAYIHASSSEAKRALDDAHHVGMFFLTPSFAHPSLGLPL